MISDLLPPDGKSALPAVAVRRIDLSPPPGHWLGPPSPREPADSGATDLRRLLRILQHRWRIIVLVTAAVVAAAAIGTLLQTPVYRATGMIELHGKSADMAGVEALFQSERLSTQYLETQFGVLRSSPLAVRVIATIGEPLVAELGGGAKDDMVTQRRALSSDAGALSDRLTDAFAKRLLVDPATGSNLVKVHFEATDARLAARVVNEVFASYAAMQADLRRIAVLRLASQVDGVRERLASAERELQLFAQEHELEIVDTERGMPGSIPHERLRALQEEFTQAQVDRYQKQSAYSPADSPGDNALDSELLRALHLRLATLRGEYAKLIVTFTEDYPRTKEVKRQLDEQEELLAQERRRIRGENGSRYFVAMRREDLLKTAIDAQRALVHRQGEKGTQYRILTRDVAAQRELYALLQQRLRGAQVSSAVASSELSVVGPAIAPAHATRPQPSRNLQLAMMVGLMLGVGMAFGREYFDPTVRTVDEVDAMAIPLLAVIPSIAGASERSSAFRETRAVGLRRLGIRIGPPRQRGASSVPRLDLAAPGEPYRGWLEDAFSLLRTAILFSDSRKEGSRSLLVTSAQPGEGKTTIAVNLALSLAQLGRRVLLIDADTRRPAAHRMFGMCENRGLVDALGGNTIWSSLVHVDVVPSLDVLPAGRPAPAPTKLLASRHMTRLLEEAESAYEFVILDSPALLINAADTRILAQLADDVIVVMRSGVTARAAVERLLLQIPNLTGVVLNDVGHHEFPAGYYAYGKSRTDERLSRQATVGSGQS